MSTACSLAQRLLEQSGALVEVREGVVEAVLPPRLSAELKLPEHVLLSEQQGPEVCHIGPGSALLERLVAVATEHAPVATMRWNGPSLKPSAVHQAIEKLVVRNGVAQLGSVQPHVAHRLWIHAAYSLHGDERREGLVCAVISLHSATSVSGFNEAAAGMLSAGRSVPLSQQGVSSAARAAMQVCAQSAQERSKPFASAMARRFARDQERLVAYFTDLEQELKRRVAQNRIEASAAAQRRELLERDRVAKLDALASRFALRLEVKPVAAVWVECPGYLVSMQLQRRKAKRTVEIEYDVATRRLVPPACEQCGDATLYPAVCDDKVHLLCERCVPRSEGRIRCPQCGPRV
jgi:hypothetical protein